MDIQQVIQKEAARSDSFYVYDEKTIIAHINRLQQDFPQVAFFYSLKCNTNPYVVASVFAQGLGADAASLGEVMLACGNGLSKQYIHYSAPGKAYRDIQQALDRATLVADSLGELRLIQRAAAERGITVEIGVRINPDFSFYGDTGCPSKFGIDEAQLYEYLREESCPNISIAGIHVHLKSQELNEEALAMYYVRVLALAERVQRICGSVLQFINMGSGMGVPYGSADVPLDTSRLGRLVQAQMQAFLAQQPQTKIIIEVGRYAVCKSGVYVTKVMDRKTSHGKTFLILKNTLNGFLRPSLGMLVSGYAPQAIPAPQEPLFTGRDAFAFRTYKPEDTALERVTLVGNLCTVADIIAADVLLPRLECGDVIIITNAGSYAAVLSPMQFSLQEPPKELFVGVDGRVMTT